MAGQMDTSVTASWKDLTQTVKFHLEGRTHYEMLYSQWKFQEQSGMMAKKLNEISKKMPNQQRGFVKEESEEETELRDGWGKKKIDLVSP